MIPVDAPLVAPPGYLLVERVAMATRRGRIIVPEGIKMSTRSCEAVVVSVGKGVYRGWQEGDRVFLAAGVGRPIKLGVREERTVYRITTSMVLARIVANTEAGIENRGVAPQEIPAWEVEALSVIDEGEAEALR